MKMNHSHKQKNNHEILKLVKTKKKKDKITKAVPCLSSANSPLKFLSESNETLGCKLYL